MGMEQKVRCECIKCGWQVSVEGHCADIKCDKCGGTMRRVERPGPGREQRQRVTSVGGIPVSYKPWGKVIKSRLPAACFLVVGDPQKKTTWKLPYREGAGGIDPKTKMYRKAGPINYHGVRAAIAAIAGARTGKPMRIPAAARKKIDRIAKALGLGEEFIEEMTPYEFLYEVGWENPGDFFEPGIDPGSKTAKYYRVRQRPPGQFSRFRMKPFGKPGSGIMVVYGFHKKQKKMLVQSILFDKRKWTPDKIRAWIKKHGFRVMGEVKTLAQVSSAIRKLFNYRVSLIEEWRNYYLKALELDKPDPTVWAWFQFEKRWMKLSTGRWVRRLG